MKYIYAMNDYLHNYSKNLTEYSILEIVYINWWRDINKSYRHLLETNCSCQQVHTLMKVS